MTYNNLRPEYRRSFFRSSFDSFRGLEEKGREFELTKRGCQRYRPPPESADSWFPEVAYNPSLYPKTKPDRSLIANMSTTEDRTRVAPAPTVPTTTKLSEFRQNGRNNSVGSVQGGGKGFQVIPPRINKTPLAKQVAQPTRSATTSVQSKPVRSAPGVICFNCRKTGHLQTECPIPRRYNYCRRCGRENTTFRTCPGCHPSEPTAAAPPGNQ